MPTDPGILSPFLTATSPVFLAGIVAIDDELGGNGDGIPNPGEDVVLTLSLQNIGTATAPDLEARVGSGSE